MEWLIVPVWILCEWEIWHYGRPQEVGWFFQHEYSPTEEKSGA